MTRVPSKTFSRPNLEELKSEAVANAPYQAAEQGDITSSVKRALTKHRRKLMAIKGVVMVGEGQDEIGRPAIIVGVSDDRFLKKIPSKLDGVIVVKRTIGEINAMSS